MTMRVKMTLLSQSMTSQKNTPDNGNIFVTGHDTSCGALLESQRKHKLLFKYDKSRLYSDRQQSEKILTVDYVGIENCFSSGSNKRI
jgi:hypothetical protein